MVGEENVQVLKNINFNVDEGEFVAILGPSGSGKTTLMNIIGWAGNSYNGGDRPGRYP